MFERRGSRGFKHNSSYLYRSRGSVNELIDDLNYCEDESYFRPDHLADLREHCMDVVRLLNGYIQHLRQRLEDDQTPPQSG